MNLNASTLFIYLYLFINIHFLSSIFLWALEGRMKLKDQGYFVEPSSASSLRYDLEGIVSPVAEFVDECCVFGPLHQIVRSKLYKAYRAWCRHMGHTNIETDANFGKHLRAALPELETSHRRTSSNRERFYVGIDVKDAIQGHLGTNDASD